MGIFLNSYPVKARCVSPSLSGGRSTERLAARRIIGAAASFSQIDGFDSRVTLKDLKDMLGISRYVIASVNSIAGAGPSSAVSSAASSPPASTDNDVAALDDVTTFDDVITTGEITAAGEREEVRTADDDPDVTNDNIAISNNDDANVYDISATSNDVTSEIDDSPLVDISEPEINVGGPITEQVQPNRRRKD